jgi:Arc/MetJ-type ribon-helix-helix transcriptional regulator
MGMDIQVVPELEDLVERGSFRSADEYVEHAVSLLHAQATWFAEDRAEINAKIAGDFSAANPVS